MMDMRISLRPYHVIYFSLLFFIFIPKINIIGLNSTAVGIKPDDILYFLLLIISIGMFYFDKKIPRKILAIFLVITILNIVQILLSNFGTSALPYLLRYTMYISIFFIGYMLAQRDLKKSFNAIVNLSAFAVLIEFIWSILQFLGILGGSQDGVWRTGHIYRTVAQTANPIELALLVLFQIPFLIYMMSSVKKSTKKIAYILIIMACTTLFMTQSRAAMIVGVLIVGLSYIKSSKNKYISLLIIIVFFAISGYSLSKNERITSVFKSNSIASLAKDLRNGGQIINSDVNFVKLDRLSSNSDPSLFIRLSKWRYLWEKIKQEPLGFGPGYFGPSIDGFYIRMLAENGPLGLMLFLILLNNIFGRIYLNNSLKYAVPFAVMAIMIVAFIVDAFYFSRFAYWFWFVSGIFYVNTQRGNKND